MRRSPGRPDRRRAGRSIFNLFHVTGVTADGTVIIEPPAVVERERLSARGYITVAHHPWAVRMYGVILVDLALLIMAFFAGFAVRAYISYRRRLRGS